MEDQARMVKCKCGTIHYAKVTRIEYVPCCRTCADCGMRLKWNFRNPEVEVKDEKGLTR